MAIGGVLKDASALFCLVGILLVPVDLAAARRPLTVRDTIATARLMGTGGTHPDVEVSPNGDRYVVRVIRGDVDRDGVWLEIVTGSLASVSAAAEPRTVSRLFTRAFGYPPRYHYPLSSTSNPLVWIDSRTIAFLWEDSNAVLQVVAVDLITGRQSFLTRSRTDVVSFSASPNGAVVYAAMKSAPETNEDRMRGDYLVSAADAFALLDDSEGQSTLDARYEFDGFVIPRLGMEARPADVTFRWGVPFIPSISQDGRWAIVNSWPSTLPREWLLYSGSSVLFQIIKSAFSEPSGWYGRQVTQLHVVDLQTGTARPLWNAPTIYPYGLVVAWSPNGRSILVGHSLLPPIGSRTSMDTGQSLAEVDVATGAFHLLPVPKDALPDTPRARHFDRLTWESENRIRALTAHESLVFARQADGWRLEERTPRIDEFSTQVRVELRQDLNTPPALYAVGGSTGLTQLALDLNPQLRSDFFLGRVEEVTWIGSDGQSWSGLLYYPVNYRQDRRYPLVIQTHGYMPTDRYSLYGFGSRGVAPGTGPGFSIYAAQVLANREIAVLQMEDKRSDSGAHGGEARLHMRGYEGAISHFDARGLIDPQRVGLSGFSRTGWHVQYALTHSEHIFAAAITSDNISPSYFEATLMPGNNASVFGSDPFGAGLETWLEESPAFSVERVFTPLRIQVESRDGPFLLPKWEVFSRLRQLNRPVEFYVIPAIEHGSHNIQNPQQVLASQEGAVEWYDFWLNGRESSDPSKREQYVRWRRLRAARDATLQQTRPRLLDWEAIPVGTRD